MKKFLTALLALCMLAFGATAESAELPVVRISVEGVGDIYAELYPETAPITVENFLKLTDQGFYNGLTFHRIISGFMVQGGDPLGNGTGGSEETIKGEFSANGVENPLQHSRGVLSMARSSAMDSASSQFFIMHADASHLDGNYAAFGKVLAGMNIVDALCRDTPVTDSNGTVAAADQPRMKEIVRVSREEAEKAMAREAENGLNGRYEDPVLGLSFPVPEGWSLQPANGNTLLFSREEGGASVQLAAQDMWKRFGSGFRSGFEAEGKGRADLNTAYFGEQLTQSISGTDGMAFTEAEYGGITFYSGDTTQADVPVRVRIGAADGRLICFIGIGEGAEEAMEQMMSGLEMR